MIINSQSELVQEHSSPINERRRLIDLVLISTKITVVQFCVRFGKQFACPAEQLGNVVRDLDSRAGLVGFVTGGRRVVVGFGFFLQRLGGGPKEQNRTLKVD